MAEEAQASAHARFAHAQRLAAQLDRSQHCLQRAAQPAHLREHRLGGVRRDGDVSKFSRDRGASLGIPPSGIPMRSIGITGINQHRTAVGLLQAQEGTVHLVELFLPLDRGDGTAIPSERIEEIVGDLADQYGGATGFLRSPAKGLWKPGTDTVTEDRVVVIEVMVRDLDLGWWRALRHRLEAEFAQEHILIRAIACSML